MSITTTATTIDPDAVLDYAFDWTAWLAEDETITTQVATVTGATVGAVTRSGPIVTVWVSGATAGAHVVIACRITTNQGRTDERTWTLTARNR